MEGVILQDGRTQEHSRVEVREEAEGGKWGRAMQGRGRVQQFQPWFTERTEEQQFEYQWCQQA